MNKGLKIFMAICLALIIIAGVGFILLNKDTAFHNVVDVKYHDGCVERFVDGELNSSECTQARYEIEMQKNRTTPTFEGLEYANWDFNATEKIK